ncbi:MAG: hypothetical protein JXR64_10345 [Spirochaetales bacterium]|nr:hypothetical protein [Spirochaetales bacterium]
MARILFFFFFIPSILFSMNEKVLSPIPSNLNGILNKSVTQWRDSRFELYSWDKSQKVLIFDTINYDFQASIFKRLAFFVEKKDRVGNIYSLSEIEDERGWNGHDYEAYDLARFFNKINQDKHEMTQGETLLLKVILENGIIKKTRLGYSSVGGAVLSCSRESPYNQRRTILWHEAYHGLYFTSKEFRSFTKDVWNSMDYQSRTIWKMYLDVLDYNNSDNDLAMNEFMAYMLQGTKDETYYYLNEIVWFRLWEKFPDKRDQINRFFNQSPTPYKKQIDNLNSYIEKLRIE